MSATTPGYRVSIEVFIPADPGQPRQMASAAALLDNLPERLASIGLLDAAVSYRFVSRHRIPSSPPAASPAVPAPTLEATPQAAAEPADAAAASRMGPQPDGPVVGLPLDVMQKIGGAIASRTCAHKRKKAYLTGEVRCLDCQALVTEVAA